MSIVSRPRPVINAPRLRTVSPPNAVKLLSQAIEVERRALSGEEIHDASCYWKTLGDREQNAVLDFIRHSGFIPADWVFNTVEGPSEVFTFFISACITGTDLRYAPKPAPIPEPVDTIEISAIAEAEWFGFTLGLEGQCPVTPATFSPEEAAAFVQGHAEGFAVYVDDEDDRFHAEQSRQDDAFASPLDRIDATEAIEAVGSVGSVELRQLAREWVAVSDYEFMSFEDIAREDEARRVTEEIFADRARRNPARKVVSL